MIKKNQSGQSLFEVVIAVAMSAVIITAIVALATNSIQNSTYSKDKTIAANYVQETIEWLKQQKDLSPEEFRLYAVNTSGIDITYCLDDLTWPSNIGTCSSSETLDNKFTREVVFPSCGGVCTGEMVEVSINVTWTDSKGSHIISSVTQISGE